MSEGNCSRCLEPLDGRPSYPVHDGRRVMIIHLFCRRQSTEVARRSGEAAIRQLDDYRSGARR